MSEDTKPIRAGEELNAENFRVYLCGILNLKNEEIEISQFPAGSSNLTYAVKIGETEYVLRRPPFGNRVKSAHDMKREFDVLQKLSKVYKNAPQPLIYAADETIIGAEFYLMERRRGLIIRGNAPAALENSKQMQRKVCEIFIENLSDLHALDNSKIGIKGKPEGYAQRQIEGWTKRYFNAKTHDYRALETAIEWLNQNLPGSQQAAIVHSDYKFDNIMLDPADLTKIVAVLDWELAAVGDPLMDLGTTLGYWMAQEAGKEMLSMPFNPRILMENTSRRELAEIYSEKSGRDLSNILYYYVFGTFKIAAIAQQIYFRYAQGFTKDKRFAHFNLFVEALGRIALHAINKGEI